VTGGAVAAGRPRLRETAGVTFCALAVDLPPAQARTA